LYTKEAMEKDRNAITALGYFQAVSVKTEDTPDGVKITYDVLENPVVTDIKLTGTSPIPEEKIKSLLTLRAGQVLNTNTLNSDIDAIQRYYSDLGYIAFVTEDTGIDAETGVLTIPIVVSTVEKVVITGNKKTKEYVFLREMKTKPGQVFNMNTLKQDIAKIYNLDVVEEVQVPKTEPGSSIGKIIITIPVTEKKSGQVMVGLGYSSQSQLVGRAEISETNFRGRAEKLTLQWETSAAKKGSGDQTGGTNSFDIGFVEPWIDKKNTSLSVNVFNKLVYRFASSFPGVGGDINGETYNERRKGASLGLSRPFSEHTRGFITFRGETVQTADIPTSTANLTENGPIRSITLKMQKNTRDFDRDPAVGWFNSISWEFGNVDVNEKYAVDDGSGGTTIVTNPLKGSNSTIQLDIRRYWSKGGRKTLPDDKRNTFAARLMLGTAMGEIPFFEQLFVGGSDTLRGYREDRFWGNKMAVLNLEFRKPITKGMTGVLFVDAGDAWGGNSGFTIKGMDQHKDFSPRMGAGLGIRVVTPIGQLRLDYGFGDEGAKTHFSIGHTF
jgi:outer membrane protein insertion porin family